jgi:hypothetical protein
MKAKPVILNISSQNPPALYSKRGFNKANVPRNFIVLSEALVA